MISIVISEKGGAERRENYDQNEITIGRVKGNDVLLPKGNVSKRHSRLIVRDGRFIVTDLKSTNGTYVNHRRITHATLVREGDRIYIGDFVLRIEGEEAAHSDAPGSPPAREPTTGHSNRKPTPPSSTGNSTSAPGVQRRNQDDIVSHFPIENDPDDSSPIIDVPAPPRVPSGLRASSTGTGPAVSSLDAPHTTDGFGPPTGTSSPGSAVSSSDPHTPVVAASSHPGVENAKRLAQRNCLERLLVAMEEELGEASLAGEVDDALVEKVDATLEAQLTKLSEAGPLPGEVELDSLREAARRELLELGPIGLLLKDENISQVRVMQREVVVHRRGRRVLQHGLGCFGTDAGVARALKRICVELGQALADGEQYVSRNLDDGRELFAVCPPASAQGHMLVLKRPQRTSMSLNSLVRSGAISRGMATLLTHCVMARANILVTGAPDSGANEIIDALAAAVPVGRRALWLLDEGDPLPDQPNVAPMTLGSSSEERCEALAAAWRLAPDYIIAPPLAGESLCGLLDAVSRGASGVIISATAGTLRHAVARLSADLSASRPGLNIETAREWLGSAVDLGLELARPRDDRLRVVRLAEFRGGSHQTRVRDIFSFAYHRTAAGGSIEGSFYASGTIPRIVEDLAARGMPLDTTIFRRHPSA